MELAEHFLLRKAFSEHHAYYYKDDVIPITDLEGVRGPILFKGRTDCLCFAIEEKSHTVLNSYYIGTDWLVENKKAVYVQPKINKAPNIGDSDVADNGLQVNYLAMLFEALKHPDVFEHTTDLFQIKWEKPEIKINQQQDLLTPLLVVQYLQVVKNLVRKGLKKSYYKVEQNLHSRVKGKILVAQTIKQNLVKSKKLNTICSFEEFGYNGLENRILKKALVFVQRYLPLHKSLGGESFFTQTFHYIMPAFEQVSTEASIRDCQDIKISPFYKEYKLAIELAKQILRRFGHNINNISAHQVSTPPFWIDMSKLFELYVLGLLKDRYKNVGTLDYHVTTKGNELDFVLNAEGHKMIIDAKYKLKYQTGYIPHEDIRQVSGYARLEKVYGKLSKQPHEVIDCLIIYPKELEENFHYNYAKQEIDLKGKEPISGYVSMYKYGVKLPTRSE